MNPPKTEPIHMNFPPLSALSQSSPPDHRLPSEHRDVLHQAHQRQMMDDPLGMAFGDPRSGLPHTVNSPPSMYQRNDTIPLGQYPGVPSPMHQQIQMQMMMNKAPGGYSQFSPPGMYGGMMQLKPCYLIVDIFHKQRGGKGVWMVIEHGGLIRVTKNVGKRVKLVIKSSIKFERNEMKLVLVDLINPQMSDVDGRFSIENVLYKDNDLGGVNAEYEIKIFILAKKLEFQVTITSPLGRFKAESNTFGTHNSGKQRKKRESVEPRPKFVLVPFSMDNQHPQMTPPHLSHNNTAHILHQPQPGTHVIPSMPIKRKRSDFDDDPRNPKKYQLAESCTYSDLRLNFSHLDFSQALKLILKRPDDLFEWNSSLLMNTPMEADIFPLLANEIFRKYPESVIRGNGDRLSLRYADMVPVILFNFTLYLDLQEQFDINLDMMKFSDPKIRDDAVMFYHRLKDQDENSMESLASKMYRDISTRHEVSEEEYLQKMGQYKELLLATDNCTGIAVSVYLHTMAPAMTDFFLVIYKSESLYQQKALSYGNEYKYVFIEPGEDGTYDGEYSVVLYIESEFHRLQGFVGLYDIRNDQVSENIIHCNPVPITNSSNLFIVGKFYINDHDLSWISQSKPVKQMAPPPPPQNQFMQMAPQDYHQHNHLTQMNRSPPFQKTKNEDPHDLSFH